MIEMSDHLRRRMLLLLVATAALLYYYAGNDSFSSASSRIFDQFTTMGLVIRGYSEYATSWTETRHFFTSAFTLRSPSILPRQYPSNTIIKSTAVPSFRSRLYMATSASASSSSRPYNNQSTTVTAAMSNMSNSNSNSNSNTMIKSSVGRLRFCYARLQKKCPREDYLRDTPSITIACDLQKSLVLFEEESSRSSSSSSSSSSFSHAELLPEAMYIAVLDAYMCAYRDAKKVKKGRQQNNNTTNPLRDQQQQEQHPQHEYKTQMDGVVNGMVSTIAIMNTHDQTRMAHNYNNTRSNDATDDSPEDDTTACGSSNTVIIRTIDPYATILHMLLELTLNDVGNGSNSNSNSNNIDRSYHWATRSLAVLSLLESDPVLTIITKNSNFEQQTHNRQARVIQYNKVLKGLVAISSSSSSSNSTKILTATRLAVQLLDRMIWSCEEDTMNRSAEEEYHDSNNNNNVDDFLVINTTTTTTATSIVPPDAKSFATVLGSPVLERNETKRLIEASVTFGVYEGYLENLLKRTFGERQLAEVLQ